MSKHKPLIGLILVVIGVTLLIWGWDKWESTIEARTHGALTMLITGGISLIAGLGTWFSLWGKK